MALVTLREVLEPARAGGYAVGAFNVHSLELLIMILEVAREERAPVILQFTGGTLDFLGADGLRLLVGPLAREAQVPVVVHLDHGSSPELVLRALHAGFSSVMIDASAKPFAENVAVTQQVVRYARAAGLSVEAELGRVPGAEEHVVVSEAEALFTDVAEAKEFVDLTGIDALAVAVGTAHGPYRSAPRLQHDRLAELREQVPVPLVLHGGSGVPAAEVRQAIANGIAKINVATEVKMAWADALRRSLSDQPHESDPRRVLMPVRQAVKEVVRGKMRLFGCSKRI